MPLEINPFFQIVMTLYLKHNWKLDLDSQTDIQEQQC